MKRGVFIFLIVSLLAISFVSAGWFDWVKSTGKVISSDLGICENVISNAQGEVIRCIVNSNKTIDLSQKNNFYKSIKKYKEVVLEVRDSNLILENTNFDKWTRAPLLSFVLNNSLLELKSKRNSKSLNLKFSGDIVIENSVIISSLLRGINSIIAGKDLIIKNVVLKNVRGSLESREGDVLIEDSFIKGNSKKGIRVIQAKKGDVIIKHSEVEDLGIFRSLKGDILIGCGSKINVKSFVFVNCFLGMSDSLLKIKGKKRATIRGGYVFDENSSVKTDGKDFNLKFLKGKTKRLEQFPFETGRALSEDFKYSKCPSFSEQEYIEKTECSSSFKEKEDKETERGEESEKNDLIIKRVNVIRDEKGRGVSFELEIINNGLKKEMFYDSFMEISCLPTEQYPSGFKAIEGDFFPKEVSPKEKVKAKLGSYLINSSEELNTTCTFQVTLSKNKSNVKSNFFTGKIYSAPENSCTDSDGGNNPLKKGTLTSKLSNGSVLTFSDKCGSKSQLQEYFCSESVSGVGLSWTNCDIMYGKEFICEDGACSEKDVSGEEKDCFGCEIDFEPGCIPYGTRIEEKFCSFETGGGMGGKLIPQKNEGDFCDNNYECLSNLCSYGKCVASLDASEARKIAQEEAKKEVGVFKKFICGIISIFPGITYKECVSGSDEEEIFFEDSFRVDKIADRFYLGKSLNYLQTSIDRDALPNVLKKGEVSIGRKTYSYTQKISELGNFSLQLFTDSDYQRKTPTIGFRIRPNELILKYVLDFSRDLPSLDSLVGKEIEILGKKFKVESYSPLEKVLVLVNSNKRLILSTGGEELVVEKDGKSELKDEVYSEIVFSGQDGKSVDKLIITWNTEDEQFITTEKSLIFPGFESLEIAFEGLNYLSEEKTTLNFKGDDVIELDIPIKSGIATIHLVYSNKGDLEGFGREANERLAVSSSNELEFIETSMGGNSDKFFIASWKGDYLIPSESYLLFASIKRRGSSKVVEVRDLVSGEKLCEDKREGEICSFGNIKLRIDSIFLNDTSEKSVMFKAEDPKLSFNKIYSQEGLTLLLPSSLGGKSAVLKFLEENRNEEVSKGKIFQILVKINEDNQIEARVVPETISSGLKEIDRDSENRVGMIYSPLATEVYQLFSQKDGRGKVKIIYHGKEVVADVYIRSPQSK